MTILQNELPFTNSALEIYITEAEKRMKQIWPHVSEYNKLKLRVKLAKNRLNKHNKTKEEAV